MEISWTERTRELLKSTDANYALIAEKTRLNYWWLVKFSSGEIKEPGSEKVLTLYRYLTGEVLP